MANSDISVPSVDHRQEPSTSTTFSIYGLAAVSITYLRSILAPILGHQMEHVSKIDRRTTKHGARFRITTSLDQQPHLHHYHGRSSQSMLPTSATNVLLSAISSGTPGSGPSQRPASLHQNFRFTVPGFDVIQHPATGPGRRGIALGIPSCFGGHEHGSAVGTMILAKVPNFTPECLWIVGSVYVGHSGATTNYSRREAFASIRQSLDRDLPC
ncbi:hypothetical protein BASA62_002048, partial [Batrachochytrium salamandrivorans]